MRPGLQGFAMPTTLRRDWQACPTCNLALTILHTSDGSSVEYDLGDWARLCRHRHKGSPLVCPNVEPLMKDWLGKS
jgi:hypothetical protein